VRLQILITNFGTNTKQASIGNSQNVVVDVYKGSRLWRYDREKIHFENETRTKPLFTHSVTQNVTHASLMILIASLIVEFTMSLITTHLNHSLFHSRVTHVTRLIYSVTNSTNHDITDSVTHGITPNVLLNVTH